MSDPELARAHREYVEAMKARMPSTWPIEVVRAVTYIVRAAPPVPPSREGGRRRLTVVR